MTRNEHFTRKGALLAALEHRCNAPGNWTVEGYEVTRHIYQGRIAWWIVVFSGNRRVHVDTFVEALEWINERKAGE